MLRMRSVAMVAAVAFGGAAAAQSANAPVSGSAGTTGTITSPTVQGGTGTDLRPGPANARDRVTGNRTEPAGRVATTGRPAAPSATTAADDGRVPPPSAVAPPRR